MASITTQRQVGAAYLRPLKTPIYDTMDMPSAVAIPSLGFFQVPQGQNLPVAAVAKTAAETNLQTSSQLGVPQQFDLFGFQAHVHYAGGYRLNAANSIIFANDMIIIYEASVIKFILGSNRISLQLPFSKVPAGPMFLSGPKSTAVDAIALNTIQNGTPGAKEFVKHFSSTPGEEAMKPIFIDSSENFALSLEWPVAAAQVNALGNTTRITMYMVGILYASL